jgi:hypothetical protein
MPLDNMGYTPRLDDWHFYKRAEWKLKFAVFPTRCDLSKKFIWLKTAYRGQSVYTGPGTPVTETRWIDKKEFLFARVKGII